MKFLAGALLVSSTLLACQKDDGLNSSSVTVGQPFELHMQQAATVPAASGGPITFTLTDVQDARCPSGMQCIWAGYAAVTVQLTDATATPQMARISLLNRYLPTYALDSVSVTLNQRKYWLRLLDVSPYPSAGSSQPTTARLRLRPA
jgi:hypothetical protein